MRNSLIRLAVIATAAIGLSACVAYPVGYRHHHHHHGYYGGGYGYHRHHGPPRYAYRDGYRYRRGYYYR